MKKRRAAPLPEAAPTPSRAWLLPVLAAALAAAALGLAFIRASSPTYDEPVHLASGWSYLASGRYRLNIDDHPPLAEMWAALPLAVLRPNAMAGHPDFVGRRRYPFADHFLYKNAVDARTLLDSARAFNLLTLAPAAVLLAGAWALAGGGPVAAAGAGWAAALCPVLVSNLALVTTDGLSAVLFAAVFFLLARPERTARVWAAAGLCAGLALAAKFNMVLLAGLIPGLLLVERGLEREPGGMPRARGLALFGLCAALALAASYRFGQLPLWWEGLRATLARLDQGRSSYLLGRHSVEGTWLYFPAALFAKTPLGLLALASWGAACAAGLPIAPEKAGTAGLPPRQALWLFAPAAAYFAASLTAKVQIGVRHLLPILPFLAVWAGLAAADLWRRGTAARVVLCVLALWTAGSVGRSAPRLLAYFNEAAGGPAGGWRWLADSNLDWGQDLPALAEEVKRRGNPPIYLAYFGVGDPSYYGLRYVQALANWNVPRPGDDVDPAAGSGRVLFAVSATNRAGVYIADHGLFRWLDARRPVAVPGHSIFLYDLTADAEGRRRLAELLALSRHPRAGALAESLLK